GALHEPYVFRVRAPIESSGGPPHSRTLARWPRSPELPPGFGVRRPCGALELPGRFMVPMHAEKKRKGSMNRRFGAPALGSPPEGGTPNKFRPTTRFKAPIHGNKAVRASHESRLVWSPAFW